MTWFMANIYVPAFLGWATGAIILITEKLL